MPFSRTNSSKSDLKPTQPPLAKRKTLTWAVEKVTSSIRRFGTSTRSSASSKSSTADLQQGIPGLTIRPGTQWSVSSPCIRQTFVSNLDGLAEAEYQTECTFEGALGDENARPNVWYNRQRKLCGECNAVNGTCDWKKISVFSDGESVDEDHPAINLDQFWRASPTRKRANSVHHLKEELVEIEPRHISESAAQESKSNDRHLAQAELEPQ